MKKVHTWRKDEVIAYLEEKILGEVASDEELELYQDYKWFGKLNKNTYTWKNLIKEMRDVSENGY